MTSPYIVRPLEARDVDALVAITRLSPEAAQWTATDYQRVPSTEFQGWVAESEGQVAGFLIARVAAGEMEILNLAVAPSARRKGLASLLVAEAMQHARAGGVTRIFLEVRESNRAAIAFYQRHGFHAAGRRPRYYSDPVEDALICSRSL